MIRRLGPAIFALPLVVVLFLVLGFEWLRGGSDYEPPVGVTAEAALVSPDGGDIGTVSLTQGAVGVIVAVDVRELTPGGHAVSINAVGACEPDFEAAGDHFDPGEGGFLHDTWRKGGKCWAARRRPAQPVRECRRHRAGRFLHGGHHLGYRGGPLGV